MLDGNLGLLTPAPKLRGTAEDRSTLCRLGTPFCLTSLSPSPALPDVQPKLALQGTGRS